MLVKLAVTLPMSQQIVLPCHSQSELLRSFMKDSVFVCANHNKGISWQLMGSLFSIYMGVLELPERSTSRGQDAQGFTLLLCRLMLFSTYYFFFCTEFHT